MNWSRRSLIASAGALTLTPRAKAEAAALISSKLMFMVRRTYATDKDIAALRTPREPEHQQHLLKFSQTVVASAIIDTKGGRVGSISISDINTRAEIERYVYDDPFTKVGIYGSITITPVDLYKVDGSYNRAPAWFAPELQRRQQTAGYNVPVLPTADVGAKTMLLVRRIFVTDRDAQAIRKKYDAEHREYLLKNSQTVISAATLDDANNATGNMILCDSEDRATIERYVNDDPLAKNGMFSAIEIDRVDLYKLDGSYNRAPAWFEAELKRRQVSKTTP